MILSLDVPGKREPKLRKCLHHIFWCVHERISLIANWYRRTLSSAGSTIPGQVSRSYVRKAVGSEPGSKSIAAVLCGFCLFLPWWRSAFSKMKQILPLPRCLWLWCISQQEKAKEKRSLSCCVEMLLSRSRLEVPSITAISVRGHQNSLCQQLP